MSIAELALMLARLERLNEAFVADICRRHDLTASEVRVLAMLRHGQDPASPSAIARGIVQTSGGLTATLRRLERRGLVARVPDPEDGRGRLVSLTEDGASRLAAAYEDLVDRYRLALADVDEAQALPVVRRLVGAFERFANVTSSDHWALDEGAAAPRAAR